MRSLRRNIMVVAGVLGVAVAARPAHLDNSPNRPRRSPRERVDYRRAKTLTAATHRPGQRPVELAGCRRTR